MDLITAAKRVLGEWLRAEGASGLEDARADRVVFVRGEVFLDVYYLDKEDPPPHSLVVAVGLRADGVLRGVGLWRLLDDVPPYWDWRFSTQEELEAALTRLRDDVLMPNADRIWRDPDGLARAWEIQRAEVEREYVGHERERLLAGARAAFTAGRYSEARDAYVLAGEPLSATDAHRLRIARRQVGTDVVHLDGTSGDG